MNCERTESGENETESVNIGSSSCNSNALRKAPENFSADVCALTEVLELVNSEISLNEEFKEVFASYLRNHIDTFLNHLENIYTARLLGLSFKISSVVLEKDANHLSILLESEAYFSRLCQSIYKFLCFHPLPDDDLLQAACFIVKRIIVKSNIYALQVAQKGFMKALLPCTVHKSSKLRHEALYSIQVIYRLPGALDEAFLHRLIKTSYRFLNIEAKTTLPREMSGECILIALDMIEFAVQKSCSLLVIDESQFFKDMSSLVKKTADYSSKIASMVSKIRVASLAQQQPAQGASVARNDSQAKDTLDHTSSLPPNRRHSNPVPSNPPVAASQLQQKTGGISRRSIDSCVPNSPHDFPTVIRPFSAVESISRPESYKRGSKLLLKSDQLNDFRAAAKLDEIASTGIAKVICGMLNSDQGGSIWFGFREEHGVFVDGMRINKDQRDEFRMGFHRVLTTISPLPLVSAFGVHFTPVTFVIGREVAASGQLNVAEIRVPKRTGSVYMTSDGRLNRVPYVRRGFNTEIMTRNMVRDRIAQNEAESYQKCIYAMEHLLNQ